MLQASQSVPATIAAGAAIALSMFLVPGGRGPVVAASPSLAQAAESVYAGLGEQGGHAAARPIVSLTRLARVAATVEPRSRASRSTARRGHARGRVVRAPVTRQAPSSTQSPALQTPVQPLSNAHGRGHQVQAHSARTASHTGGTSTAKPAVKQRVPPKRSDHGRPPERGQPPGQAKAKNGTGNGGGNGGGRR